MGLETSEVMARKMAPPLTEADLSAEISNKKTFLKAVEVPFYGVVKTVGFGKTGSLERTRAVRGISEHCPSSESARARLREPRGTSSRYTLEKSVR